MVQSKYPAAHIEHFASGRFWAVSRRRLRARRVSALADEQKYAPTAQMAVY